LVPLSARRRRDTRRAGGGGAGGAREKLCRGGAATAVVRLQTSVFSGRITHTRADIHRTERCGRAYPRTGAEKICGVHKTCPALRPSRMGGVRIWHSKR